MRQTFLEVCPESISPYAAAPALTTCAALVTKSACISPFVFAPVSETWDVQAIWPTSEHVIIFKPFHRGTCTYAQMVIHDVAA